MVVGHTIRKASPADGIAIAKLLAHAFEHHFSRLGDQTKVAKSFENAIDTGRFVVSELDGEVVGFIGIGDCNGRAVSINKKDFRRNFGFIKGSIAFRVMYSIASKPLSTPPNVGMIDFVGVSEKARGQGIAKAMLQEVVEQNSQYSEFILYTEDNNAASLATYTKFGFVEYKRVPIKWAKAAGFKEEVWMRYSKAKGGNA